MTLTISRRTALTVLGSSVVMGIPLARAADAPTLLHISLVPIFDVAPYYAANAEGYFAAEGLTVTTDPTIQGGAVGIPALMSGSYDIVYSNSISVITALERGIDLRLIAQGSLISPPPNSSGLLQRKGDGFRTGKDLEGKTVGVNARYNIQWLGMRAWVKKTGGDPDKVTYREVPIPSALDAIKNKQVDVGFVLDPYLTIGRDDPALEFIDWPLYTVIPGGATAFWIVTGKTAEEKPDLVRRFVRAYRKGANWVNAHHGTEPFIKLVSSYTKIDPKLAGKMVVPEAELGVTLGPIKDLMALMREHGLLKSDVDVQTKIFQVQA
ncbi:MAG TPA: ABC transporter substrate-binding protein [Stellaceae bacterium]|nr:ABC transporter substrate-binding protein [Stellaceae bacterium]